MLSEDISQLFLMFFCRAFNININLKTTLLPFDFSLKSTQFAAEANCYCVLAPEKLHFSQAAYFNLALSAHYDADMMHVVIFSRIKFSFF